jgi:hypothetical protein
MSLNVHDILSASDLKVEQMDMTPYGWEGAIYIRSMTGKEMNIFSRLIKTKADGTTADFDMRTMSTVCALAMCDGKGARLFPDEKDGCEKLLSKSSKAIIAIFRKAMALSSLADDPETGEQPPGKA